MLPTPPVRATVSLAASVLLLTACGGVPAATSPAASAPAITASAVPVPTTRVTSASASVTSAAACPAGEYTVTSFKATGRNKEVADGSGGEIAVEFGDGRYEIDFDKDEPITLKTASSTGLLTVDGKIEGTYAGTSDRLTFTVTKSSGTARTRVDGKSESLPMTQVGTVLGLADTGSATCAGDRLTLHAGTSTFEMVRDD